MDNKLVVVWIWFVVFGVSVGTWEDVKGYEIYGCEGGKRGMVVEIAGFYGWVDSLGVFLWERWRWGWGCLFLVYFQSGFIDGELFCDES